MFQGAVGNVLKSSFCGLGLYQSYRYSRALAVGWKEQRGLCTMDFIASVTMLYLTSQENLRFLGGDPLVARMNKFRYVSFVGIPALHYATKKLEGSENAAVRDAVNFTYVHLSDVIMLASAVQALAATYYGFNRAGNLLQLVCMTIAVVEQGVFWVRPKEDNGPMFKINEGECVRAYEPFVSALNLPVGLAFSFLYRGIFGKINAVMGLMMLVAPELAAKALPKGMKKVCNQLFTEINENVDKALGVPILPTPNSVEDKWIANIPESQRPSTITKKHFQVFKIEDHFPSQTLKNLEAKLQQKLKEDSDPDLQSIGYKGTVELTKREMLVELLGCNGNPGSLRFRVIASRTREEKIQKELELKNIFGALHQDWEERKSRLVMNYDNFLCDTAISSTITELCLEFDADLANRKMHGRAATAQELENRISHILQHRRDRNFHEVAQGLIMRMKSKSKETKKQWEQEEADLYAKIEGVDGVGAYLKSYLKRSGLELFKNAMLAAATARHQINISVVIFGRPLGLSYYDTARRDVKMQLAKNLQDIRMLDRLSPIYDLVYGKMLQKIYADGSLGIEEGTFGKELKEVFDSILGDQDQDPSSHLEKGWREELTDAIVKHADTRLDFGTIRDYLLQRAEQFGKQEGV